MGEVAIPQNVSGADLRIAPTQLEIAQNSQNCVLRHEYECNKDLVHAVLVDNNQGHLWETGYRIVWCESSWNKQAVGDHGTSLGLWQIHLPAHPTVTRECSFDATCSTLYSIKLYEQSGWHPWSCYRKL